MKGKSSKNSYKTAKSWRNAQNEVVIFVQNAILLFSEFSCMIKPENEGGKNSKLPGKWDRVSAAEDHLRERSDKEDISPMRFA
jgi:hypothetical protein